MAQRNLPNASGRQKGQARLLQSRMESEGTPKAEARTRAATSVKTRATSGRTRVVSKEDEKAAKGLQRKPQRQTKRRA